MSTQLAKIKRSRDLAQVYQSQTSRPTVTQAKELTSISISSAQRLRLPIRLIRLTNLMRDLGLFFTYLFNLGLNQARPPNH